ncbi:MAG: RNA ligase [Firmicutes bacterium ADurb.Bin419]|nr:MAG: RNA ligase [Firmicutes bacterium ADurb.Bin419]
MTETFIKYPEMKTLFKLIPSDEKGRKWDATSGEILPDKNVEQIKDVIIFGELCGEKIQKGGNYFTGRKFIIFDIYDTVTGKFFSWDAVKHFAGEIGVETVPEISYNKEDLSVANVKDFILSQKSVYNENFGAEGMVIRYRKDTLPVRRWMAKIRKKDFRT